MRFSLTSLIRLSSYVVLALGAVAVGLGKLSGPAANLRIPERATWQSIHGYYFGESGEIPRFLDMTSGRSRPLPLPEGDRLEFASRSPWRDERGRSQVVGLWSSREGRGRGQTPLGFGLARFSFPDGRPLDRIATSITPMGPPCWYPGTLARVLFAGGDGQLFRLDFEGDEADEGRRPGPRPIPWAVPPPGDGLVLLTDPCWPSAMATARLILVSLTRRVDAEPCSELPEREIWWLRLDPGATRIVGAGRLTPMGGEPADERYPTLSATPDGGCALAYLARSRSSSVRQLRVVPVRFDDRGVPEANGPPAVLAEDCLPIPPAFSPDGRAVSYVRRRPGESVEIRRLSLPDGPAGGTS